MSHAAQLTLPLAETAPRRCAPSNCSAGANLFEWQWHGRQMFIESRNDFRFPRKLHRVVYHLADTCEAADEKAAREKFREQYPDAKETGITCIGPVKSKRAKPNHCLDCLTGAFKGAPKKNKLALRTVDQILRSK